jgi:metallophosphoesterase (TIGR00282 family)
MGIDVVIANSDNVAHGRGVTRKTAEEVLGSGVDFLTSGDHAWDNPQAFDISKAGDLNFVFPANLPDADFHMSRKVFEAGGIKILVMNLAGNVFMNRETIPPFETVDKILKENEESDNGAKIILLDFHAEATSEKKAIGRYLNGRVSAVVGTHTHVQTADEEILSGGTAYITDLGMVGVENSILGCEEKAVLEQYINKTPFKYQLAEDDNVMLEGVVVDVDEKTGKAVRIERLRERVVCGSDNT